MLRARQPVGSLLVVDKRRRSAAVGVGAVALGLIAVGSLSSGADERGVCVDRTSNVRVDDDVCDDDTSSGTHGWYYIPAGRRAPAEGQSTSGQGSFVTPSGSFDKGGVSSDGGKVTRGGFLSGHGSFGG
jgi:hypothetical protein